MHEKKLFFFSQTLNHDLVRLSSRLLKRKSGVDPIFPFPCILSLSPPSQKKNNQLGNKKTRRMLPTGGLYSTIIISLVINMRYTCQIYNVILAFLLLCRINFQYTKKNTDPTHNLGIGSCSFVRAKL